MFIKKSLGQSEKIERLKQKIKKDAKKEYNLKSNFSYVTETTTLPVEAKEQIEEEYERSNAYVNLKEKKLDKEFNKNNSNLKKVGDYLYQKLYEVQMVSKKSVAKELNITLSIVENKIARLNFYRNYPLTIIPVPFKKGFIQAITRDENGALKWERRKFRTIETLQHTKEKGVILMKRFGRKQKKVVKVAA